MTVKRRLVGWTATLLIAAAGPAFAQQVNIKTQPPATEERRPEVVPPGLHYEMTRPDDSDFYPDGGPKVRHDPAFIEPLATSMQTPSGTGEMGVSGWTAPAIPVGPAVIGRRDNNGWLSFGFSIVWGGPSAPAKSIRR